MKHIVRVILVLFFLNLNVQSDSVELERIIEIGNKKKTSFSDIIFGSNKGRDVNPVGLMIKGNELLLIDQINASLVLIDMEGKIISRSNRFGSYRFSSPVSGSIGKKNEFYISDSGLQIIAKFEDYDKFSSIFYSDDSTRITGISYYKERLYCTDTKNHRIIVLNRNGNVVFKFGERGGEAGEFNYPTHIFVDQSGIYVTDALNFRIQIFNLDGLFVKNFGRNGKHGGEFSKPKAIAVDSKGRIFVSDVMFDNVQIFDQTGQFFSYFGSAGSGKDDFWMPGGVSIDKDDRIFVSDTYNHRIKIYKVIPETK